MSRQKQKSADPREQDKRIVEQSSPLKTHPFVNAPRQKFQGGWGNILQMHTESVKPNMNLFYLDDSTFVDKNEPDLHGTWASTGYYLGKLDEVAEKVSFRTNIFAIPNSFQVPDAKELVDLVYHPPEPSVKRTWDGKQAPSTDAPAGAEPNP